MESQTLYPAHPVGWFFIIPGLGLSRTFTTEEEALTRRIDVADALGEPIENFPIHPVPGPGERVEP